MKKIQLSDLTNTIEPVYENPLLAHIKSSFQCRSTNEQPKAHSFFDMVPKTELEKSIATVLKKKTTTEQKTRENIILAEFDKKMRRIRSIKSKSYRKIRRRENAKKAENSAKLEDSSDEEIASGIIDRKLNELEKDIQKPSENLFASLLFKGDKKSENSESKNGNLDYSQKRKNEDNNSANKKHKTNEIESRYETGAYKNIPRKLLVQNDESYEENSKNPSHILEFGGKKNNEEEQREMVKILFKESDEFTEAFNKEKKEVILAEMPGVEKKVLPGWGSWGGTGVEVIETKYNTIIKIKEGIDFESRKDSKHDHVIINEQEEENKYKIDLPFGYTKEEYKAKMNLSVSKEINTMRIFNKFVKSADKKKEEEYFVYESKYGH